jgi:SAM-dependent methyltransferase
VARAGFAWEMLMARWSRDRGFCPYCESRLHRRLQRKKLLIEARKCEFCGLIFRWPCDDPARSRQFYEGAYNGQQATTLPESENELRALAERHFRNSPYDRSHRVTIVQALIPTGRVLDFGCSWGYSLVQWRAAGYQAVGFECARDRARFGRERLGLDIRDEFSTLESEPPASFDVIYADHVMEHLSLLRRPLDLFARLLRPGGILIFFVPNGGGMPARRLGTAWGALIGESHTVALTAEWCNRNLPAHGFVPRCFSGTAVSTGGALIDDEELACLATRL